MLEIIGGRSETDAHVWGECMNELELAVLLAETVRTDNRVDVDVSSLIRRLFWTEVAVERRLSDEKGNSPLFGQISRLQQSDVIVEKAKESYELGCCYRDGTDGLQDDSLAKVFFEISAMAGNADAQNCLGARYHEGKGVEKNLDLAFTWYMEAAKQGHEKALYNLGLCFENGWGCEPDIETAKQCYAESAGKGYGLAKTALNRLIPNKPQITGTMSTPANSKIDWGSLVATGAVVLGGAAIAAIDAFMNRKKS